MSEVVSPPVEFLFVHVPKFSNYYKPLDDFMFINYIPMGVFALCDALNRSGVGARIKHVGLETIMNPEFSIVEWVRKHQIKIVGMSLHWHYQSYDVICVAKKIKQACPGTIILLGGFTASRFSREILENFAEIDAVIAGDADKGVVPFAEAVLAGSRDFSAVPNCIWRSGDNIVDNGITYSAPTEDLDSLDFANLDLLDNHDKYRDYFRLPMFWGNNASVSENLKRRLGAEKLFPLAVGRGCRVNCTFCGGSQRAHLRLFNRREPVFRSVNAVVDSMEKAISYGYTGFVVCFDPRPEDDSYYLELMQVVRQRGVRCGMSFESWGLPTRAFVDAFRQTFDMRTSYIGISAESGSEEIRRKNKGIFYSNQQLFDIMDHLEVKGVPAIIYLTMGLPFETMGHLEETAQFAKTLKSKYARILQGVFCLPIQIEPTSEMFENPEAYGVRSTRKCFMDFYHSHGETNTGPFSHLGYSTEALDTDHDRFALTILSERCKNYCLATPRLFRRVELRPLAQLICKASHARWKRKGFGKPAEERRTFR